MHVLPVILGLFLGVVYDEVDECGVYEGGAGEIDSVCFLEDLEIGLC